MFGLYVNDRGHVYQLRAGAWTRIRPRIADLIVAEKTEPKSGVHWGEREGAGLMLPARRGTG